MVQVAIHALQILNELVALDLKALGTTALLSVVLAVAKYAGVGMGPSRSQDTRLQAAYFLQFLAHTNLLTAQLLVTCQVGFACCFSWKAESSALRDCPILHRGRQVTQERRGVGEKMSPHAPFLCAFHEQ